MLERGRGTTLQYIDRTGHMNWRGTTLQDINRTGHMNWRGTTLQYIDRTGHMNWRGTTLQDIDRTGHMNWRLVHSDYETNFPSSGPNFGLFLGSPCRLPRQHLVKELYFSHKEYQLWFGFIPLIWMWLIYMGVKSRYNKSVSGKQFGVKERCLLHQRVVIPWWRRPVRSSQLSASAPSWLGLSLENISSIRVVLVVTSLIWLNLTKSLSLCTVIQLLCSPCAICDRHSGTETSLPSDMYSGIPLLSSFCQCYIFIITTVAGTVDPL